jgi:hypothetical protein
MMAETPARSDEEIPALPPGRQLDPTPFSGAGTVYYANTTSVYMSTSDMRISFGKENPLGPSQFEAHVYVSYQLAKALAQFLSNSVATYEKATGVAIPDIYSFPRHD